MSDENIGRGGSYVINDSGERELVERTQEPSDVPPDPAPAEDATTQTEPADAGIFSPVAPADQSTTE